MFRKDRNKPSSHKHCKGPSNKPSTGEPVIAERISKKFGMSEDILAKAPVIIGYGRHRLCIENYRNIIEYTADIVRVQTKTCRIHITGDNLVIAYFRDDGMCVTGNINSIEYH